MSDVQVKPGAEDIIHDAKTFFATLNKLRDQHYLDILMLLIDKEFLVSDLKEGLDDLLWDYIHNGDEFEDFRDYLSARGKLKCQHTGCKFQ